MSINFPRRMISVLATLLVACCLALPASAQTEGLTAKLPNGLTLDLVGVTENTAPSESGWRADGGKLGKVADFPPGMTYCKGGMASSHYNPERYLPEPGGRDLLIELRGIKKPMAVTTPSIIQSIHSMETHFFSPPHTSNTYSIKGTSPVSRFRLSGRNERNPKVRTAEIYLTDEPWGKVIRVSGASIPLTPIEEGDLHYDTYRCFRIVNLQDEPKLVTHFSDPSALYMLSRVTRDALLRLQVDAHVVDREFGQLDALHNTDTENGSEYVHLPYRVLNPARFSHFEYRLRPYRYYVTFRNISMEAGHTTKPTVSVEILDEPKLDDKKAYNKRLLTWLRALNDGTPEEKAWAAAEIESWAVDNRPKSVDPRLIKALQRCQNMKKMVSAAALKKGWLVISVGDWCTSALKEINHPAP